AVEYQTPDGEPMTVAILHERLGNVQQAWQFTLNEIGRYYECVGSEFSTVDPTTDVRGDARWRDWLEREPSPLAKQTIASFLPMAALIGQRTGEMHVALANVPDHTSFAPEPFTPFYQRSLFQSMRNHAGRVLRTLRRQMPFLPESVRDDASAVLAKEAEILGRFRRIVERKISALRIRCHGDYHLGQVLYTGKDFAIIDFEGEPMRSISERRIKRSPLRDVAGMIRSFHYAAYAGLMGRTPGVVIRTEDSAQLARWANFWYQWTSIVFLKAYLHQVAEAPFVPRAPDELECLLDTFLLEKSLYETHYELNNRPDWIGLPLRGVLNVLEMSELRQP
ncbi:MAG TPA: phosphotransferase, partial [Polyangium sp.]|nr:phosphotransferase [Polyangium sp.]